MHGVDAMGEKCFVLVMGVVLSTMAGSSQSDFDFVLSQFFLLVHCCVRVYACSF